MFLVLIQPYSSKINWSVIILNSFNWYFASVDDYVHDTVQPCAARRFALFVLFPCKIRVDSRHIANEWLHHLHILLHIRIPCVVI